MVKENNFLSSFLSFFIFKYNECTFPIWKHTRNRLVATQMDIYEKLHGSSIQMLDKLLEKAHKREENSESKVEVGIEIRVG